MLKANTATRLIEYTTVADSAAIVGLWPFSDEQQTYVLVANENGSYGYYYQNETTESGYGYAPLDLAGELVNISGGFNLSGNFSAICQTQQDQQVSNYKVTQFKDEEPKLIVELIGIYDGKAAGSVQSQLSNSNLAGHLVQQNDTFKMTWRNYAGERPIPSSRQFTLADFDETNILPPIIVGTGENSIPVNGYLFGDQSQYDTSSRRWRLPYQRYDGDYEKDYLTLPDDLGALQIKGIRVAETYGHTMVVMHGIQNLTDYFIYYDAFDSQLVNGRVITVPFPTTDNFAIQSEQINGEIVVSLFAGYVRDNIFHTYLTDVPSDEWLPVTGDVLKWGATQNNLNKMGIVYQDLHNDYHLLTRDSLDEQEENGGWFEENLGFLNKNSLLRSMEHEVLLDLYDDVSTRGVSQAVTVKGSPQNRIIYQNHHYYLNNDDGLQLETDSNGRLSFMISAESLVNSPVTLLYNDEHGVEQKKVVDSSEQYRTQFGQLNVQKMKNAVDSDGNKIIDAQITEQELVDTVSAIKTVANTDFSAPLLANGHAAMRLYHDPYGKIIKENMTFEQVKELLKDSQPVTSLWSSVSDFFWSASQGFIKVVDTTIEKVFDGISVTVTYVLEKTGIKNVINFIAKKSPQLVQTIETVFNMVKVNFKQLTDWLADLIGWDAIKRSKKALDFITNSQVLEDTLDTASGVIKESIQEALAVVDQKIIAFKESLVSQDNIGQHVKESKVQAGLQMSDNYLLNTTVDYLKNNPTLENKVIVTDQIASDIDDLMTVLDENSDEFMATDAFKTVKDDMAGNLSQLRDTKQGEIAALTFGKLLDILQRIIKIAMNVMTTVVDAIFKLAQTVLSLVKSMAQQDIQIPIVSQVFEKIFDMPLSMQNLSNLLLAVSWNMSFKAVQGRVPFLNDAEELAFENTFMQRQSGTDKGVVAFAFDKLLIWLGLICQFVYYIFQMALDLFDATKSLISVKAETKASIIQAVINIIWLIVSFPVFFADSKLRRASGWAWLAWGACLISFLVDCVCLCVTKKSNEKVVSKVNAILSTICGIGYLAGTICSMLLDADYDPLNFALTINEFMLSIGSALRFLILFKEPPILFAVAIILDAAQASVAISMMLIMGLFGLPVQPHTNTRLA